jgi:adenine-specific DNA-methyltransferase
LPLSKQKMTGSHFTPSDLSNYLSKLIFSNYSIEQNNKPLIVLDPACGDGALLLESYKYSNKIGVDINLYGIDSNQNYLDKCESKFKERGLIINLKNMDFLEDINLQNVTNLFNNQQITPDIIIANPPYVRTQILGSKKAQSISKKFNLSGRVDLYYPFIIGMTEILKPGGIIGVITSNKYLFTKGGKDIRNYLTNKYDIIEVIDLGDTKLFNASVLPCIFIGQKKKEVKNNNKPKPVFRKIYSTTRKSVNFKNKNNIYDILNTNKTGYYIVGGNQFVYSTDNFHLPNNNDSVWSLLTKKERGWVNNINHYATNKLSDIAMVKVGVKTTSDKVFIRNDWNTLPEDIRPESKLLKPLVTRKNSDRWSMVNNNFPFQILYTHTTKNGLTQPIELEKYPKAKKYLINNRDILQSRTYLNNSNRNWWEIWVPHKPVDWMKPKIIFPDISRNHKFFYDDNKKIVKGDSYWIIIKNDLDKELIYLLLGLCNSQLIAKYHSLCFNNLLYSGKYRFYSQYVGNYPLPDINSDISKKIIGLVKNFLNQGTNNIKVFEGKLDSLVFESFNSNYLD